MTTLASPSPGSTAIPLRNRWKGRWMLAVALLHTLYAAVVFPPQLQEIVRRGVFNSVQKDPAVGAVVWFVLFGVLFALLGWAGPSCWPNATLPWRPFLCAGWVPGCWLSRCWALCSCPHRVSGWRCRPRWPCAGPQSVEGDEDGSMRRVCTFHSHPD